MCQSTNGNICAVTIVTTQDQGFAWNALRDFLEASAILKIENDEVAEVRKSFEKLALPKIASDGRLMEWNEEFEEVEPGHRHIAHLWGFMPGNRITLEKTPELEIRLSERSVCQRRICCGYFMGKFNSERSKDLFKKRWSMYFEL